MTSPLSLAVIGGGQLARMMQQAAIGLGVHIRLLAEAPDVSAAQVIPDHFVGDYTDIDDLRRAAEGSSVVTFDHEHVPPEHLRTLAAEGHMPRPGPGALIHAQDKITLRTRLDELAVPSPRWAVVASVDEVVAFGLPCVLKTPRGGYDGKGVWVVRSESDAAEALAGDAVLAEELVDFRRELSAQVARRPAGETVTYPVVESRQENGVCKEVIAPAPDLADELSQQAQQIAIEVAEALDVTGMLAVEMFETDDGRLLVNEFAMRPHNTGHWSIDGAATSQFENHLRGVLDLPLGPSTPSAAWSVMYNVLGGAIDDLEGQVGVVLAAVPEAHIHLYGKSVKAGRKVGHLTVTGDDLETVLARARQAGALLQDGSPIG
ncbi:5-(carboxyamino)imidazole ribonucleotide synthase [Aeromicrobium panaciterrae]|uniref:5-(carboxyamino)imidazole ribonucleotide synthase n=1 Tax=Aeromicrobium panaciterrae TaxID=363861 RepID=UPI0031DAEC80